MSSSGTPAARSCRRTTRCSSRRSATSSCATSRARPTWPTGTRAPPAGSASASPRPGPARPTWSPGSPPRCSIRSPWCASPARSPRSYIGSDAFQETDITGVTLPITKHNYLVTRAEDIAPMLRQAFYVARSGRPGPVLVDITKDAQQASTELRVGRQPRAPAGLPARAPARAGATCSARRTSSTRAERPDRVLRARHHRRRRERSSCSSSSRRPACPVASTLLGLGGFPATPPALSRDDGDARRGVGQHRPSRSPTSSSRSGCASTIA